jgi:hypothetical protein
MTLLFLVNINDMPGYARSQTRLFADDCLMYRKVSSTSDCIQLQEDLDNLIKAIRPFLVELQMQQDLLMTNFFPVQQSGYGLTRNSESMRECCFVLHNDQVSSIVGCGGPYQRP